ncbi:MAG: YidC/Oxa1 family membrane protein insertase [Bacilli bacterium]|nr:YidC/Oxa1 family membrane protein insertase [Bacilli bacterium]
MNKNKNKIKIIIILLLLILTTGCTKSLVDENKKAVKNPNTGQTLTENILCQPTDKDTIKAYEKAGVKIEKLPKCEDFKINSGGYDGLWSSLIVKPLSWSLLKIGHLVKSYAISLIILTLIIRLLIFPLTLNMAKQSEIMKEMQPKMQKIQKKYAGKEDQESMMKMQQETMMLYKEFHVNPALGCIFSFLQLPLLLGFFEAVQRTPAIFEANFLGLQLGTTINVGITSSIFYSYLILLILIAGSTFLSFKMNQADMAAPAGSSEAMPSMKMMPYMMSIMIIVMGIFMPSGLCIYWVTSNLFTIIQNIAVKRRKKNGKA